MYVKFWVHEIKYYGEYTYLMKMFIQLKELKERQKMQLRQKALKLGLNPEALTGKYPVRFYSIVH